MDTVLASVTQPISSIAKTRPSAPTANGFSFHWRRRHSCKNFPLSLLFLFIFPHVFSSICILTLCILVVIKELTFVFISVSLDVSNFPPTGLPANSFHPFLSVFCSQGGGSVFDVFLAESRQQEELKC